MRKSGLMAFALPLLGSVAMAGAAVYGPIYADPLDYEARSDNAVSNGSSGKFRVGTRTTGASGTSVSVVFSFALPALGAGETVSNATVTVNLPAQTTNLPATGTNVDVYGLPLDPAPVTQNPAYYFSGPSDGTAGVTKLQDDFLVNADVTASGSQHVTVNLSSYINALYSTGGFAPGDFATIRFSYDQPVNTTAHNRYEIWGREAATGTDNPQNVQPFLSLTTVVPEPASVALICLSVGGLVRRRREAR
jgi:hypothetical protein